MTLCKLCKNKTSIAGQSFTKYICSICNKEYLHENTNTPLICSHCSNETNLCEMCGKTLLS
jgi:ribosomal protein S27E